MFTSGHGPLIKMADMPIYVKTLKNLCLENQESFRADSKFVQMMTVD